MNPNQPPGTDHSLTLHPSQLARMQQTLVLTGIIGASVWVWWAGKQSWVSALLGIVCLLTLHAIVLAVEFVAVAFVNQNDSVSRASPRVLARAWWQEIQVAPTVFAWRQPFRWQKYQDDSLSVAGPVSTRAVVFVHGFVCNRGLWQPWMNEMRKRGLPYTSANLEPVFGGIDDYLPIIEDAIRRAADLTNQAPLIVCHSMGGLAVRAWLALSQDNAERVHRVVTIGTPHHGTWLARFSMTSNGQQMRQGNPWLTELVERERMLHPNPYKAFTCWYSNADNIVFPASTAMLPGADNRHVPGVAHVALTYHPLVMSTSLALLAPGASSSANLTEV